MSLQITKTDVNDITAAGVGTKFNLVIKAGTDGVVTVNPNGHPMTLRAIVASPIKQYDIDIEGNLYGTTWEPLEATITRTGLETTMYHETFDYFFCFPLRITFSTLLVPNNDLTVFIFPIEADPTM